MKFYVAAALALAAAITAGLAVHFLVDVGKTECVATQATAQVREDQAGMTDWLKVNTLDFKADTDFAKGLDALNFKTSTLQGADHALKARTPAPAAGTLVPNPFPRGFGVCWLAAGTGDEHQAAACQAYGGDGAAGQEGTHPRR